MENLETDERIISHFPEKVQLPSRLPPTTPASRILKSISSGKKSKNFYFIKILKLSKTKCCFRMLSAKTAECIT